MQYSYFNHRIGFPSNSQHYERAYSLEAEGGFDRANIGLNALLNGTKGDDKDEWFNAFLLTTIKLFTLRI